MGSTLVLRKKKTGPNTVKIEKLKGAKRWLPTENGIWAESEDELKANWPAILMECLEAIQLNGESFPPVVIDVVTRDLDHFDLFECRILDEQNFRNGSNGGYRRLYLKDPSKLPEWRDLLCCFDDHLRQQAESRAKYARRKKAIESLEPWQRKDLEL